MLFMALSWPATLPLRNQVLVLFALQFTGMAVAVAVVTMRLQIRREPEQFDLTSRPARRPKGRPKLSIVDLRNRRRPTNCLRIGAKSQSPVRPRRLNPGHDASKGVRDGKGANLFQCGLLIAAVLSVESAAPAEPSRSHVRRDVARYCADRRFCRPSGRHALGSRPHRTRRLLIRSENGAPGRPPPLAPSSLSCGRLRASGAGDQSASKQAGPRPTANRMTRSKTRIATLRDLSSGPALLLVAPE